MSQGNVKLVRDMRDAFIAGNLERALSGLDDEVVWHGAIGGLVRAVSRMVTTR